MAFTEGASSRIEKRGDAWHCVHCDFSNPRYQPVVGHLGKHTENAKKVGRPKHSKTADPLDLSITQLIMRLEDAESELASVQALLIKERKHTADIRHALSSFMRTTTQED